MKYLKIVQLSIMVLVLCAAVPAICGEAYIDVKTGFSFPRQIAEFNFQSKREYGSSELGYGLNYANGDGVYVTVIVYDLGVKGISNGVNDSFVEQQFHQAQGDIEKNYKSVRKLQGLIVDPVSFLSAGYTYIDFAGEHEKGYIFVRGQTGKILKVRATSSVGVAGDPAISKFMHVLAGVVGVKQKGLVANAGSVASAGTKEIELKKKLEAKFEGPVASLACGILGISLMETKAKTTDQDFKKLVRLCRPSAEMGNVKGQFYMGIAYNKGKGVTQDYKEAVNWFRNAAKKGHAGAQYNLGRIYVAGKGVVQDYKEAAKWYEKAAEQGVVGAQFFLGIMYVKGEGVDQDYKEALKWFRYAAEQGVAASQFFLGTMYLNGKGVPQDYIRAHMWFNLAGSHGFSDGVNARDAVAEKMSEDQIAEAQGLAREWVQNKKQLTN